MWAQLHTRDSRDISDNDVAEKTGLKNYASLTTAFTTTTFTIKILAACHHWDSESFGTVQTGYCLKVFPEDRGWQVYFESIGLNFFGWFLLSTLSLSFALPTFHRTLGWGSIPRQCNESVTIMLLYSLTWSWILVAPMVLKRSFSGKLIFFKMMLGGEIKIFHWVEVGELLCCSLLLFQ